MRIYLQPIKLQWMDGTYTHREDLYNVLRKRGHCMVGTDEEPHDVAYTYNLNTSPISPSLLHLHNYNIGLYKTRLRPERIYSVNSEFQKQQFSLLPNMNMDKVFVLPNYVNEQKYLPSYSPKKKNSIVLLGRIQDENFDRLRIMIQAMKYLPTYTLYLVGWFFDNGKSYVENLIKISGVNNVQLIGELRGKEKIDFITSCEVGIGVGRSMMEMALLGLPVLVFGHSWGGWIAPELIDRLRFDNFSTRSFERLGDLEMIEHILISIKNPRILNRAVAFEEFGLMHNIWRYEAVLDRIRKG